MVYGFFPSSELLLDPSPPRVAGTQAGQLARSTARGAIAARAANPTPFIARARGGGLVGLGLSLAWEAWNFFEGQERPLPPVHIPFPQQPPDASYFVTVTSTWQRIFPAGQPFQDSVENAFIQGRISSIGYRIDQNGGQRIVAIVLNTDGTTREEFLSDGYNDFVRYISLDSVVVIPNAPNAEPLPATFPYLLPPGTIVPSPNIEFPITIPERPGYSPTPVVIPIIIPNPSDLARNPIPILYPTAIPADQRRRLPQMWITPEGIQVGRGGIGSPIVTITGDGVSTVDDPNLADEYETRNPPSTTTCNADPEPPGDCCSCEEIRGIVFEELDSKIPPKRPTSEASFSTPAQRSNTITLPPFTKSVDLQMVEPGVGAPTQSGELDAPDVVYNGWYSYGVNEETSERIPFNYNSISVAIPSGVRFFSYTITRLGTAAATVRYIEAAP